MATQPKIRILALSLLLVSGAADAGLFSKKKPAPPPPPEPAPVVVPVEPPPPPPPIPLEVSGIQTAPPQPVSLDRVKAASPEVQAVVQWVAASKDNAKLPFIVVDKANAQVYAFTPFAQLKATAPILLGMGKGDVALVSQDAPMSAITPDKRITPAGRYLSRLVVDVHGKTILSIDPVNLISLHIVAKGTPAQRRAERLASTTKDDNRISFGCINVPPAFFTDIVSPDFAPAKGMVYVLPEKTTAAQLFGFQPPTNGSIALQTALQTTEAAAPTSAQAAALQTSLQTGAPLQTSLQAPASTAPVQTSLQPAPLQTSFQAPASPTPLQTSLQPASLPAPIEAPAPSVSPETTGSTAPVSAPDTR
jgi:hypothetical protein